MRGGDVGHIEGRILSHQDHVDPGKVEFLKGAKAMVIALPALHLERATAGVKPPVAKGQRLRQIMEQCMSASLRFECERECRIRVDIDRVDRVHLDRYGER